MHTKKSSFDAQSKIFQADIWSAIGTLERIAMFSFLGHLVYFTLPAVLHGEFPRVLVLVKVCFLSDILIFTSPEWVFRWRS